jgi:hypothetical protein
MRIEQATVEAFTIYDANRLDPVLVLLQDLEPGKGRITIECYGEAWSTYFSAMGDKTRIREFLRGVHVDYLANRMRAPHHKDTKVFKDYLQRIVCVVLEALQRPTLETPVVPDGDRCDRCGIWLPPVAEWSMPSCPDCVEAFEADELKPPLDKPHRHF